MDEITMAEMLLHYQDRLLEISEQIADIRALKEAVLCAENGWKGMAADACLNRLLDLDRQLTQVDADTAEVCRLLGTAETPEEATAPAV